jgi:hypothetical protein
MIGNDRRGRVSTRASRRPFAARRTADPTLRGSDRDVMCLASCGSQWPTSSDTSSKADQPNQQCR